MKLQVENDGTGVIAGDKKAFIASTPVLAVAYDSRTFSSFLTLV